MGDKLSSENFELRIYGCKKCHNAFEFCDECGHFHEIRPVRKMFCRVCNAELVDTGEDHKRPGEMMGFDGYYLSDIYECPQCHAQWNSETHEQMEEVYVGQQGVCSGGL